MRSLPSACSAEAGETRLPHFHALDELRHQEVVVVRLPDESLVGEPEDVDLVVARLAIGRFGAAGGVGRSHTLPLLATTPVWRAPVAASRGRCGGVPRVGLRSGRGAGKLLQLFSSRNEGAVSVLVEPVRTTSDLNQFIAFPYTLHRRDPMWVPPLRMDVRTILSKTKNPFFEHAEAEYFVARRDGRVVGRIAAIVNHSHNKIHGDHVGFYGFFESVDEPAVASALFDTAAAWLRGKGMDTMRGPMNPSINDECGLLVDGFDTPPAVLMPHNPAWYVPLHERYGFVKAKDLLAFWGGGQAPPERFIRASDVIAKRLGLTLRPLDMKRFAEEVELVKKLFNEAWEQNWGYVPMTDAELDLLAKQLKPIIIADLVCFAEIKGRVVGFAVAIPDFNVALKHNPSGRLFPGILKILWYSRKIDRARVPLLGTLKEYRGKGIDALLYHWIWTRACAHGMPQGEGSWLLEDNAGIINGLTGLGFRRYKTYRIYDKKL